MIMYIFVMNNSILKGDNRSSTTGVSFNAYPSLFRTLMAFVIAVFTEPILSVLNYSVSPFRRYKHGSIWKKVYKQYKENYWNNLDSIEKNH